MSQSIYHSNIRALRSAYTTVNKIAAARREQNHSHFKLSEEEMRNGCRLGFDSYANMCCAGRHARVESFIEGKTVTATGFSNSMPAMENLPLANVLYAFNLSHGEVYILQVNNSIYLGDMMEDSLLCPNQCRDRGIEIDTRPKVYCNKESAQTVSCPEHGIKLNIKHHGPLPFLPVQRPTIEETLTCMYIDLVPEEEWNHYGPGSPKCSKLSAMSAMNWRSQAELTNHLSYIGQVLMGQNLDSHFSKKRLLQELPKAIGEEEFRTIEALSAKKKNKVSPKALSELWLIGLKAARRTLKSTTHTCICTIGNLTRRFKMDKAHMRYKKLSTHEGSFYVDTLFTKVKSIRGYTCGNLYITALGFKKFFPMESKTGLECSGSLQTLIHLVGIPPSLHSDNAPEFVQGNFRIHCRQYNIQQTATEPYSPWQNQGEAGIHKVKSYVSKMMERHQVPLHLW